jgi:hypothetical protein
MKPRYLLSIMLFTVFAVLAGVWAARTQLAGLAITSAMQRAGLSDVSVAIDRLDPGESRITRLAFSLENKNDLIQLVAQDIRIRYTLRQVAAGRIETVTIEKLVLHQQSTEAQPGTADSTDVPFREKLQPLQVIAALQQALADYLLFDAFSIQQLSIDSDAAAFLQHSVFRLNCSNDGGVLSMEFTRLTQPSAASPPADQQQLSSRLTADSLNVELRFAATGDAPAAKLDLHLEQSGNDTTDTIIAGNYRIDPVQLQRWLQPVASISSIAGIAPVDGTLSFRFLPEQQLVSTITAATDNIKFNTYEAVHVAMKLKTKTATADPLQNIAIENGSYITIGKFSYADFSLAASPLYFVGELAPANSGWSYTGGFRAETLNSSYLQQQPQAKHVQLTKLQLKQLAARISADADKLAISGDFAPASVPGKFGFTVKHSISTGQGQLTIKPLKPLDLNAENHSLSQLVSPWSYPFDLLAGNINLWSQADWSPKKPFRLSARIKLEDGGGTLANDIVFSGLALDHELELLPALHSLRASRIDLKHLDSGVTSSNISTRLALQTTKTGSLPQLAVQGLHGEIFGGSFSGDDFIYDLNKNKNHFIIKTTDIDLARIVETQQLESIEVTGKIDGTIPIEISEQGLSIEHGALVNAVRAGTIRYNPAAGSEQLRQNPLTAIALDALRDFRYSHLAADVNFVPDGTLTVNLQLQGTSPELDTDRPVHLNINTEQNLTALLKSLRFAQGISDRIDDKVRRQYEKSRSKN